MEFDWALQYIGLPFAPFGRDRAGLDCWGLVRLVYQEVMRCELPMYDAEWSQQLAKVCHLDQGTLQGMGWRQVEKPEDRLAVVAMTSRKAMHHVGLYLPVDGGRVLHAVKPRSVIQPFNDLRSCGYNKFSFYVLHTVTAS